MSTEALQIRVGADLDAAIKELTRFRKEADQAFSKGEDAYRKFATSYQRNATQVARSTNNAQNSVLNFSRIVQDAPYVALSGNIAAIANNIDPLIESFGRARKEAGSFGGALKQMGGALIGPAGIGLAVSLVTSFLVLYGDRLFKTKSHVDKLREAQEKAKQAAEDFMLSLDTVSRARLQGEQNAQKELINLRLLYEATQNTTLSLKDRKRAVDELQSQYPAYFKSLKDETILAGGAKSAYDELTLAILRNAKAMAARKELESLAEAERLLAKQKDDAAKKEEAATKRLTAVKAQAAKEGPTAVVTGGMTQSGANSQVSALDKVRYAQITYTNAVKETSEAVRELSRNQAEQAKVAKEITSYGIDAVIAPTAKIDEPKLKKETEDKLKKALENLEAYVKSLQLKATVDFDAVPDVKDDFDTGIKMPVTFTFTPEQIREGAYQDQINEVTDYFRESFKDLHLEFPSIDFSKFANPQDLADHLARLREFGYQAREVMAAMGEDVAIAVGEGLGNVLSGGSMGDMFKGIMTSIGTGLQRLGAVMIATSKAMATFKAAFNKMSVAGQLAAGIAMTALGTMVKNAAANAIPFANGGIVYGPTNALVGEYAGARNNPEVIAPLNKLKDLIQPQGMAFPEYLPMQRFEGPDLLMWYERARRQNGRYT